MLLIEDNVIYLTRGDDAEFSIEIRDEDGTAYELQKGDVLVMTVREKPSAQSHVVFQVERETNQITIAHADTSDKEVGRYSADIELRSGGKIRTIWPTLDGGNRYRENNFRNFVIMPEVTQ